MTDQQLTFTNGSGPAHGPACPDCGADWPGFANYEPCPRCGMGRDDIEAAAAFGRDKLGMLREAEPSTNATIGDLGAGVLFRAHRKAPALWKTTRYRREDHYGRLRAVVELVEAAPSIGRPGDQATLPLAATVYAYDLPGALHAKEAK